ncbi:MAG: hypothetical protein AAB584_00530 [Patescibacteria group bacterium]
MKKLISFLAVGSMVFSFVLINGAWADSTIGVNMSTTGTLTVNSGSATAVRFQNGSGTNLLVFDGTSTRLGVNFGSLDTKFEVGGTASATNLMISGAVQFAGNASVAYSRFGTATTGYSSDLDASNDLLISGALEVDGNAFLDGKASISGNFQTGGRFVFGDNGDTGEVNTSDWDISSTGALTGIGLITADGVLTVDDRAEIQGTASASYLLTGNTLQVAGNASVAYSRFGTTTTNHANYISASNDLLVSGDVEIRGSVSFGGTASVSGVFTMNDGRFRPNSNSATAFRFQNTAGTTNILIIDTSNTRVGVSPGTDLDTKFEVGGTASATNLMISGAVQFAGNASVAYSRLGTDTTNHGLSASNDLLITGFTEHQNRTYFDATASAAYFFSQNAAQFAGNASVAYSRFGTGATTRSLAAANDLLVTGLLEVDSNAFFDSKASISSNLQISGRFIADTAASHSFKGDLTVTRAARVGTTGYQDTIFEVGGTASVGTNLNVGEVSTATTSIIFETSSTTKGVCLVMTNTAGTVQYLRLFGSTLTINTTDCR